MMRGNGIQALPLRFHALPLDCPGIALDWFSFLMRFAASQMRFLSENDVRYALVKENGL